MDFNPPANARVIEAAELDEYIPRSHMPSPATTSHKIPVELIGPVVLKGAIAGKKISVISGGLWIDGDVENCDITVRSNESNAAESKPLQHYPNLQAMHKAVRETSEAAAEAGVGLFINGNVTACDYIQAPTIAIGGNIIAGSHREKDIHHWSTSTHFRAMGGHVHVDGNVIGQQETRSTCDSIQANRCSIDSTALTEDEIPGHMMDALDTLEASGNIRIGGDVQDFGLAAKGGVIISGKKSGYVFVKDKSEKVSMLSAPAGQQPAQKNPPAPSGQWPDGTRGDWTRGIGWGCGG